MKRLIGYLFNLCGFVIFFNNSIICDYSGLDKEYSKEFTDLVEFVYGNGLLSQGGTESIDSMFKDIDLNDKKILDIGSGLGGVDIYLATKYNLTIDGLDAVKRLVNDANCRKLFNKLIGTVNFFHQENNLSLAQYNDNTFDLVFSKESLLHVSDKLSLLKEIFRVLKPNGKLIILDWVTLDNILGPNIKKMMELDELNFFMSTIEEYKENLIATGFVDIYFKERNKEYIKYTKDNIKRIKSEKNQLCKLFDIETYEYSLNSWKIQKEVFRKKEVIVGLFKAIKP